MRSILLIVVLTAGVAAPVLAECVAGDASALKWLDRMSHSLRETSYRGVFTYQHGGAVQTMRITHSVRNNLEQEQVTRLTGAKAVIVRTEHPLDCIHPGHRLVRLGSLYQEKEDNCGVSAYYRLKMGDNLRVAGRDAVTLNVLPRDGYRYGYRMALDRETGLLLKTQTVAQDGRVLERFQFADVEIGDVDMDSGTRVDVLYEANHGHGEELLLDTTVPGWTVRWLPRGFMLTDDRAISGASKTYTDGLASFSVFVESVATMEHPGAGQARQGGTTAYTRGLSISGRPALVTVLGEVPVNTARRVADSVTWADSVVE